MDELQEFIDEFPEIHLADIMLDRLAYPDESLLVNAYDCVVILDALRLAAPGGEFFCDERRFVLVVNKMRTALHNIEEGMK